MGMDIIAYRVRLNIEQAGTVAVYPAPDEFVFDRVPDSEWKSERYAGRKEFCAQRFWKHGEGDLDEYKRIRDFEGAREWVSSSTDVPDGNREWLLALVGLMERDSTVWIRESW